jgi:hypothetical protein
MWRFLRDLTLVVINHEHYAWLKQAPLASAQIAPSPRARAGHVRGLSTLLLRCLRYTDQGAALSPHTAPCGCGRSRELIRWGDTTTRLSLYRFIINSG